MPYLLTATPSSPTSWVKMETESVMSAHSELSSRSRINNLNNKLSQRNNYISTSALPKSNLSVNNFPTLPPLPSMPPTLTSLSNYSLSRSILVRRSYQSSGALHDDNFSSFLSNQQKAETLHLNFDNN